MLQTTCRICGKRLHSLYTFGRIPLANIFTHGADRTRRYPLTLTQCGGCGLVQLGYIVNPANIFPQYGYVSGASGPLVEHLTQLARETIVRLKLSRRSAVLDVGANDGTFLKALGRGVGLRVGVDPARAVSSLTKDKGIHMVSSFFSEPVARRLVKKYRPFDLIISTHTLANIIDFRDYFRGIDAALAPDGRLIIEVALVDSVISKGYFDSIYHEHYAYFSPETLEALLARHGFVVSATRRLPFQGGSLLVYARRGKILKETTIRLNTSDIKKTIGAYKKKMSTLMKRYKGKTVVGFGAPAKAVTLVHVCDLAPYLGAFVDSTKMKQGHMFPGTRARIYPETYLKIHAPDAIVLFSWNYADAILPKIKRLVKGPVDVIIPFPKLKILHFS